MVTNISGIVSGMDTNAIVDALASVQRIPINKLKGQKAGVQSQISKVGEIKGKMNELKDFLEEFGADSSVLSYSGSTTDEDVMTVDTSGDALPGTYDIEVLQLAKAEKNRSDAFEDTSTEIKAGTLTLTVKEEDPIEITINKGDTVFDVVDAINASDVEVFASIINDGTSSYIQISSKDTGHIIGDSADDAIIISESYTGATGAQLNLTQVTQATNSKFTMDGLNIEQTGNSVGDVLDGVTLNLLTLGEVSISVDADKEATKENLAGFVESYNAAFNLIAKELKVTQDTDFGSTLAGDFTIKQLKLQFQNIMASAVSGTSGTFNALSQIGIRTSVTGLMEIDDDDLDDALDKDITSVAKLFSTEDTGISQQLIDRIEMYTEDLEGVFKIKVDSLNDRVDLLDTDISDMEMRVDKLITRLKRQFSSMEMAINQLNMQGSSLGSLI
jgi:flagellar hook-associated protein 2